MFVYEGWDYQVSKISAQIPLGLVSVIHMMVICRFPASDHSSHRGGKTNTRGRGNGGGGGGHLSYGDLILKSIVGEAH